jgi:hypothetical protein
MPETSEHYVTKEQLDVSLARLENKLDAKFNALDGRFNAVEGRFNEIHARFNGQRLLLLGIALGIVAQIVNGWIMHLK